MNLEEKTFTYEEALKDSKNYFKGDEMVAKNFINKYALKDSFGNIYETNPDQMHHRLAREIARIEQKYENPLTESQIYEVLKDFKYIIPGGGNMSGIGNTKQIVSLSNCFVVEGASDSYSGILKTDQEQVQLMKRRGGVGHDLGKIRPGGTPVQNSAMTSTGIVPFMERYSNSTREVAQDGRRGALMLTLPITHPDAEKFIDAKLEQGKITGANISVKIDDEFMEAVRSGKKYIQKFPIYSENPIIEKEIDAKSLWDKIIHNAWKSAEPGILFWDTILRESVPDSYAEQGYTTVATNPCGEIPLCPYDSCRLIAINLYNYVDKPFTKKATFNKEKFKTHAHYAQRIMDDIIDLEIEKIGQILKKIESDPEEEETKIFEKRLWEKIKHKTKDGRRAGIGITAEADMLAAMGLIYGTKEATDFSEKIHKNFALEVYRSSVDLAEERGPFSIYDPEKEKDNPFINRIKEADQELYERMVKKGRRNIALLTVAPTGTVSQMTQTTSGIEPTFLISYTRNRKVNPNDRNVRVDFVDEVGDAWEKYPVFHHKFETWLELNGYDVKGVKEIAGLALLSENKKEKEESIEALNNIISKSPYHKATSADVDWVEKVRMQGKIQKWVDHSISVTVNVPEDTPENVVSDIYMTGWKEGCKGITIYREGSRKGVLDSGKNLENKLGFTEERPEIIDADLLRFKNNSGENGGEDWIAFIGKINGKPYEIFTGKSEGDMLYIPKNITEGKIKKVTDFEKREKKSRYDFSYTNEIGFDNTIGGISHQFNREFWNLARLVSSHLKHGTPYVNIVKVVSKLDDGGGEGINTWKAGVVRAIKKYIPDGTESGDFCNDCKSKIIFQNGCETCECGEKCS